MDPQTGLYYYRARYYSASLGRFLQTDPIGYQDQMNLYGYVANDPLNWNDPSGKERPNEGGVPQGYYYAPGGCGRGGAWACGPAAISRPWAAPTWEQFEGGATATLGLVLVGPLFVASCATYCGETYEDIQRLLGGRILENNDKGTSITPGGRPIPNHGKKGTGEDYVKGKGWQPEEIDDVIDNPASTEPRKDDRSDPKTGKPRNAPTTKYWGKDGRGVVVNDETGEVISVDDKHLPPPKK